MRTNRVSLRKRRSGPVGVRGVPARDWAGLGRPPGPYTVVRPGGGIPPRPRERGRALTLAEREEIACRLAAGASLRAVSRRPGAGAVDGQSRSAAPRRARRVSRQSGGGGGVGRPPGGRSAVAWPRAPGSARGGGKLAAAGRPSRLPAGCG